MKNFYIAFIALFFTVAVQAQETPLLVKEGPRMNFEKHVFSMGNAPVGKTMTRTYEFINDGTEPLLITNTSSTCTCVAVEMPNNVAPGKKGTLKLIFIPTRRGSFKETLYIKTNVKDRPFVLNFGAVAVK